ncbi:hypothetical protein A3H53_00780 [Candidatus Nomurabacteria bacterium RIFCSPLOWO2_02_FULL_40_10]|uniref:Ribbon-helix-helix protein CopG domain-containing protein n=2 Tax=Candidatus Nomuraibacteriota TaxID=1752729 RepID=A0A1F6XYA3_9BACT|nr:MAG: hypothetical protein A2642_05080 [Candidatus Nomurabacteria bacterium RIFCSPHIGHO2_01_FULL_39_10]OGI99099.1 MAG: hypothetical protein A3H53_00780 [Candidatus Nomurabacteria bacterium RIFCSPLOWO2_02_FULL_40_10]
MKSITFTNNLSSELMNWMETYSARHKLTRRAIIEKALNDLRKSARQKEYASSFKRASLDREIKNMTEDGMGDYFKQLINLEK